MKFIPNHNENQADERKNPGNWSLDFIEIPRQIKSWQINKREMWLNRIRMALGWLCCRRARAQRIKNEPNEERMKQIRERQMFSTAIKANLIMVDEERAERYVRLRKMKKSTATAYSNRRRRRKKIIIETEYRLSASADEKEKIAHFNGLYKRFNEIHNAFFLFSTSTTPIFIRSLACSPEFMRRKTVRTREMDGDLVVSFLVPTFCHRPNLIKHRILLGECKWIVG